jgi:hypothetical protein
MKRELNRLADLASIEKVSSDRWFFLNMPSLVKAKKYCKRPVVITDEVMIEA